MFNCTIFSFIVSRTETECSTSKEQDKGFEQKKDNKKKFEESHSLKNDISSLEDKTRLGPVVRLPNDTKIVMRLDAPKSSSCGGRVASKGTSSHHGKKVDLAAKIDEV